MTYYPDMPLESYLPSLFKRLVLVLSTTIAVPALASGPNEDVKSFLTIAAQADGRCQNFSAGGKLAIVRNDHPKKNIRFRLIRLFVDIRQPGRTSGIAEAGSAAQNLGCTIVDGREQRWIVEKAEFTSEVEK
jgi:hypothetical protein